MDWFEWKSKWERMRNEWQSNWEKYDNNDSRFDDNLIAVYEFPDSSISRRAFREIGIAGGRESPCAIANCKIEEYGEYDRHILIHYRCPDLPLVIKICEAFDGELVLWAKSRMEKPPQGGEVYEPKESGSENSGSGGCYIATACYGSYDCLQVLTFRNFRDRCLDQTIIGKILIKIYYALSPSIARWLKNKYRINAFIRVNILERIYNLLKGKAYS